MPRKSDYCIAIETANGTVHRAWNPRKVDAIAFGKAMLRAGTQGEFAEVHSVAVVDCYANTGNVAWEFPKGAADRLF